MSFEECYEQQLHSLDLESFEAYSDFQRSEGNQANNILYREDKTGSLEDDSIYNNFDCLDSPDQ